MQVVIGGASGFLGTALTDHLRANGHTVARLVRSGSGADASLWDPAAGVIDQKVIDAADVVINLSGASISRWPRTREYRQDSRLAYGANQHDRQGDRVFAHTAGDDLGFGDGLLRQ